MGGAMNVIESSYDSRQMRSDRVVGAAIMALIEKYGFKREELFIINKHGFLNHDDVDKVPYDMLY